jgi:hypothetical protein
LALKEKGLRPNAAYFGQFEPAFSIGPEGKGLRLMQFGLFGWEHAADMLPSVVGQMAAARGAEERTAWRQPVDLIALYQRAGLELPYLFSTSDKCHDWSGTGDRMGSSGKGNRMGSSGNRCP